MIKVVIKICELSISLFLKFSIFFCISGDKRAAWNSAIESSDHIKTKSKKSSKDKKWHDTDLKSL
jgi:hypothetical protein